MLQFHPAGQVTAFWQLVIMQSISHSRVPGLHDVHGPGQLSLASAGVVRASGVPGAVGSMQNPSTHLRTPLQSACLVHSKSPLR
jgi:hypothetical protein